MSARARTDRRRTRYVIGLVALLAALAPAALLANHQYNDVPPGDFFHDDIDAITRAGLTSGCGAPNPQGFCPGDPISRQAEAAFLHRGLSRVAMNTADGVEVGFSTSFENDTLVADVDLTVGGTTAKDPSAHQYVKVDASIEVEWSAGDTPFPVALYLTDETTQISEHLAFTVRESGEPVYPDLLSFSWVFHAGPGPHTFELWAYAYGNETDIAAVNLATLVATTHTFGELSASPLTSSPQRRSLP